MAEDKKYGTIAWLKPGALDRESLDVFAMTPLDVKLAVFTNTAAVSMMENPNFDISSFDRNQRPGVLETVQGMKDYAHPAYISVTGQRGGDGDNSADQHQRCADGLRPERDQRGRHELYHYADGQ